MSRIYINGAARDATPEEEAEITARQEAWAAGESDRQAIQNKPSFDEIINVILDALPPDAPIDDIKARLEAARRAGK